MLNFCKQQTNDNNTFHKWCDWTDSRDLITQDWLSLYYQLYKITLELLLVQSTSKYNNTATNIVVKHLLSHFEFFSKLRTALVTV